MNHKKHDRTFERSLLLLSNDETGKSELHHTCHSHSLMSHTSQTYFYYCLSCAVVAISRFYMKLV